MKKHLIIPTFNEAENLTPLVKQIILLQPEFYITIVDDNSPDGTGRIADSLSKQCSNVNVIHKEKKSGLGKAYVAGFKYALAKGADLLFEMDADFSHDPVFLEDFCEASKHADFVIGSRYLNGVRVNGWRFRRLLLSKLANIYVSYVVVKPVWDFTAGFRCYKRKVIESLDLDKITSDGYAFQIEMTCLAFRNGFKLREIPIIFSEREHGYSKISRRIIWEAFWTTLKYRAPIMDIFKHLKYFFKDYSSFIVAESKYLS